jgi:general secretion pathway protein C
LKAWLEKGYTLNAVLQSPSWLEQPWVEKLSQWIARGLLIGLVLILAWQLAVLLWLLLEDTDPATITYPSGGISTSVKNVPTVPAVYDLFANTAKPVVVKKQPIAPKNLRLTLHGLYATSDPKQGFALISSARGTPKNYAVDESIKPDVVLSEIYADRVLLLRNGTLVTLMLPKNTKGIQQKMVAKPVVLGMPGDPVILQKPQLLRKLKRYRRQLQQNPMAMGRLINGSPVMRKGQIYGVKVDAGTDPLLINELGLQPGDILLNLNDTPLNDIKNLPVLIKALSEDKQFDITLERGGEVQTLNIYLEM